jgi:23S rRNA pseudouridine2605 synthase
MSRAAGKPAAHDAFSSPRVPRGSKILKAGAPTPGVEAHGASAAGEKLHKVLARAGIGSRRVMERWIDEGRVSVDGRPATLGERVQPAQIIRIDGRPLSTGAVLGARRRILIYHKPEGEMCTRSDPEGRPTVFDRLPGLRNGRWVAVGRLDYNTQGLLLLTTDGELANRLMHPSSEIEREYAVRVLGQVAPETLERLTAGIELDDGPARFEQIADAGGEGANHWYHVTLKEGRNREVRRLWEAAGLTVSRLIRVRYGPVTLPRGLRAGRWADMDKALAAQLIAQVGVQPDDPRGDRARARAAGRASTRRAGIPGAGRRAPAKPVAPPRAARKPARKRRRKP